MTVHAEHGHAHGGARSEEDRISTPRIVAVGVASLLIFIVSGAMVAAYFKVRMTAAPPPPMPADVGRSKIGMVEQQLFGLAERGQRDREARYERLGSYGWVDRRSGVAHIPIDQAMELVVKGVRAKAGSAGQEERRIGGQP
ncbi:MAG TPA: hypothetical protein VIV57_10610 [Anaeromyxobacter sp.]